MSFPRRGSTQLLATSFPGRFNKNLLPPSCGQRKPWVCFQGGEVLTAGCCSSRTTHLAHTEVLSCLSLSLQERRSPRQMVPADPHRPRSVCWERIGDTKPLMDGRAKHPGPSLSATPNLLERLPHQTPPLVQSLNCILSIFPEAVTKKYEIMLLTSCQILIQRAVLFSKEEQIRLKYIQTF